MKKVVIYQIGRLDPNAFNELEFEIKGKVFKTSLSSIALKGFFNSEGYEAEITLLYPVSLPLNPSLNNKFYGVFTDFHELIQHALHKPEEYLKDPSRFFNAHPHSKEAEYRVLHSLGEYKTLSCSIKFHCYYHDIVLVILTDMLQRYLSYEDGIEEIIIDISSGHNIYVSALIEAFRYLGTWVKLYKWNGKVPSLKIASSDPVIPGIQRYKIYTEEQKVKAFFCYIILRNKEQYSTCYVCLWLS